MLKICYLCVTILLLGQIRVTNTIKNNAMKKIAKEPVKLRQKEIANGNISLYLDIYRNGKRTYEFLKMYLIPEKTKECRW